MKIFWIIFEQEFLLLSRNLTKIFSNSLFFLISVVVFFLISQNEDFQSSKVFYSITIIWFSLLSCLIFSTVEFLKKDFDDGTIEQILTSVDNLEIYILAKMLANWFISTLPILILLLPISFLIEIPQNLTKNLIIIALLAALIINFICSFCGSLSILGNSAPVIATIAMPLIIPVTLVAIRSLENELIFGFKTLAGLSILSGSLAIFATAKIVKIACE